MSGRQHSEDSTDGSVGLEEFPNSGGDADENAADTFREPTLGVLVVSESLTITNCLQMRDDLTDLLGDPVGRPLPACHPVLTDQSTAAVKEAFETGEVVEFECVSGSSHHLAVNTIPREQSVLLHLRDASDYMRLRRELKQTRKTLGTLEDGIYILDEAFVITGVNDAVTEITGYNRDELVGAHASKLAGDETLSMATEILEQLRSEDSDVGLIESSIQGADGEPIPVETRFSSVTFPNGDRRRVGLVRDVRERKQNEHLLRALNRSARALLRADSEQAVCETIVDVAADIWPDVEVVAYSFDRENSRLDPLAAAGTEPESKAPGSAEWEAFATGMSDQEDVSAERPSQQTEYERGYQASTDKPTGRVIGENDEQSLEGEQLLASLETYGLLKVEFDSNTEPTAAVESAELLAANAVAGLERVARETELAAHRKELSEQNSRLQQARKFNDLLRRINGTLVEADTLSDVATAVCDHLVDAAEVEFAWFGETYRSSSGLQPVAVAGESDGYLGELSAVGIDPTDGPAGDASEPTIRAVSRGEPMFVPDTSAGLGDADWRERALVRGCQSIASIPIWYNDLTYGVLSVYANQQAAFDGVLGDLLADLGETIGNAINSLETKRSLHSQTQTELELRVEDRETLSARLSSALGEAIRVDGIVLDDERGSVVYLETEGDPAELASDVLAVDAVNMLDDGAVTRAAVTVNRQTLFARLVDYGATVDSFRADGGAIELTVQLPPSADVRQLVEALGGHYDQVELVSRRENSLGDSNDGNVWSAIEEQLTDRQYEVVRAAYLSGYFDWPRDSTGEEVAEALDITQPTFNRHLRTTEQKLFSTLFGDDQ